MQDYFSPMNSVNFFQSINDILSPIEFVKYRKKQTISNAPSVIDIEASSFYEDGQKRACMYAWVFGINGRCIRGRTWDELLDALNTVKSEYHISLERRFIIYIQNLSYEFQWFKDKFEWETVFSMDSRKPLYAVTKDGIEFRCSYLLSGYSLEKMGENLLKYKVNKAVGDLDYRLIRHSDTPLTDKEWGYILNDGLVVMAYIQEEIERMGDISKLPLTKTGYVRLLCREQCLKGDNRWSYNRTIKCLTLTPDTYRQLKRTYMGGFTHANVNYVDRTMYDVDSFDFTSSYPAVMVSEKYPMSPPFDYEPTDTEDFIRYLKAFCCMFDVTFNNICAITPFENYISLSRCTNCEHFNINNGRVIEAEKLTISLTEQDFFIIARMYKWDDMQISNMKCFYKGYLPKDFILTILELYKDKTELKGVEGKEVEYLVSKGMINSCYGMCVTDPCRDEIIYDGQWSEVKADVDTLIEKYNKDRNRFLYYPWGVWVTAYARKNLFTGILEFGDDYIYSDTDSIKVINTDKHRNYIEKYNETVTNKIKECLEYYEIPTEMASPKTIKGKTKPLGVWEYEGRYTRFKTLGAKRYLVEEDGETHITIAGVSKSAGMRYLKHTYKTNDEIFKNFTNKLYFPPSYERDGIEDNGSGKLCHTYIDGTLEGTVIDYMGNEGYYKETSCVHMENTDYTLSLEDEFIRLLMGIKGGHLV